MKKFIIIGILILLAYSSFAIRNWKAYTNTTHIFDVVQNGQKLTIATWGGLVIYNLETEDFEKIYMTMDGLTDNDIRALDFVEETDILLIGTKKGGINRLSENGFLMPISETLGLASKKVNKIIHQDSLLFIATKEGISVFADNPEFPFPFLLDNYSTDNGLFDNNVTSLQLTENNYLLCGSNAGLDYVHIDSMNVTSAWIHLDEENSIFPSSKVSSISTNGDKIIIGTENGYVISDSQNLDSWEVYELGKSIFPVYLDGSQNIWYSYGIWDEDQLVVIDSGDTTIVKIDSLGNETIWLKDDLNLTISKIMGFSNINGHICAYTWGEGFLFYDGVEWNSNIKPNSIEANIVTDIAIDCNNKIWISNGYLGLEIISKGTKGISSYDGELWKNYSSENDTLLKTNNVLGIGVDSRNRKWFACWQFIEIGSYGLTIFDEDNEDWQVLSGLTSNSVISSMKDAQDRMWVNTFNGINIVEAQDDIQIIHQFETYFDEDQEIMLTFIAKDRIFFGSNVYGLQYWNDTSDPETGGIFWERTPFGDLHQGHIYAIDSRSTNFGDEVWIASSSGLFMYDYIYWYKYGTQIKKQVWFNSTWYDEMTPEYRYVEGQERLYGSVPTYPTALYVDPFGKIWIGTHDNGITIYQPEKDKFTNYNINNSPLLSNSITDFAYEKYTGTLYIGTSEGLNSVEIGIAADANLETKLYKTRAFPNPFHPDNGDILKIENISSLTMPEGNTFCNIYELSGDLVIKLEKDIYEQFSWNGKNKAEKKCSSGIYFYIVFTADGQISKGKIALIR